MIGDRELAALAAIEDFVGDDSAFRHRIALIEAKLSGVAVEDTPKVAADVGVTEELLQGAMLIKSLAGQVNVVIHAAGIVLSLPHVLAPGERVMSLSLGAGNTGRDWDLETDQQIAEFKLIRWKGRDAIRQSTLFVDVFHLAEAQTEKRRVLYLTGLDWPLRFLNGRRKITSVLEKHGNVMSKFAGIYGANYTWTCDYWQAVRSRIELVDLEVIVPGLARLA